MAIEDKGCEHNSPCEHSAELYLSGGTCPPFSECPEDWFDCEKRGTNSSGLGTKPNYNINIGDRMNCDMFPAPPICKTDNYSYTIAAHRGPATFALSRHLDFNKVHDKKLRISKGWNNQDSLLRWYHKHAEYIQCNMPFGLQMAHVPPKHIWHDLVWCVECPIEGIVFDIVERFTGTVLAAGIDGGVADSGCINMADFPDLKWSHECNRIIEICLTSIPPINEDKCKPGCGGLDGWCIAISPIVCCWDTGK